jgi:phage recombination protein Bet
METTQLATISEPRLPMPADAQDRYGIDTPGWRALVEGIFPQAQSVDSVALALSYAKARNLDPFKRTVHIVPIWDKNRGCMVDTVWPGIAELRTTAFRTGQYAGKEPTQFGPELTTEFRDDKGKVINVTYPEWAQVTIYRIVRGHRVAFSGPRVVWTETFAQIKRNCRCPNAMWQKRPLGQLEKCAEAGALRTAFPEELGGELAVEEVDQHRWHGRLAAEPENNSTSLSELLDESAKVNGADDEPPPQESPDESNETPEEIYRRRQEEIEAIQDDVEKLKAHGRGMKADKSLSAEHRKLLVQLCAGHCHIAEALEDAPPSAFQDMLTKFISRTKSETKLAQVGAAIHGRIELNGKQQQKDILIAMLGERAAELAEPPAS